MSQDEPTPESIGAPRGGLRAGPLVVGALLLAATVGVVVVSLARAAGPQGERVRAARVVERPITSRVLAQGKAKARQQVEVASEISGRVAQVSVKLGERVKRGDPLFALEDDQLKNAVEQLRTALAGAEAVLKRATLALAEAERGLQRDERLRDQNVVAEDVLRTSRARVELARVDQESARAGVDRARLDLQRARDALQKAKVSAPIDGVVVAVGVEVGQVVGPSLSGGADLSGFGLAGGSSAPAAPVVVADLAELVAKLEVDELDVGAVKDGQRVLVTAQGIRDFSFEGRVERTGLMGRDQGGAVLFSVDVAIERTVAADARRPPASLPEAEAAAPAEPLQAPAELLRPGMSVTGEIEVEHLPRAVVAPVSAVLEGDGEGGARADRVFVVEEQGERAVARLRRVKLGPTDGDAVAILSGLQPGERVVEGPYRALRALDDGDPIVLEPADGKAADAGPAGVSR